MGWEMAVGLNVAIAAAYVTMTSVIFFSRRRSTKARMQEADETIKRLTCTDPVTGCRNRTALQNHMDSLSGSGVHVTMVYLDVDGFKQVNDRYGYVTGDRLLMELSARFAAGLDESEMAFRIGGDEFAIVQTGGTAKDVAGLLQKVRTLVEAPLVLREGTLKLKISVGAASGIATDIVDPLLREADHAMLKAKTSPIRATHPVLFPLPQQPRRSTADGARFLRSQPSFQ